MIRSFLKLVISLLPFADHKKPISICTIKRLLLAACFLSSFFVVSSVTAADYYWTYPAVGSFPSGSLPSPAEACTQYLANRTATYPGGQPWAFGYVNISASTYDCFGHQNAGIDSYRYTEKRGGDSCPSGYVYNSTSGVCDAPVACPGDSIRDPLTGGCVLECPAGSNPDPETMTCQSVCAEGQFYDFESESCKWPEDENCPTGSNWNPATQDCVCDGDGVLSNISGFRMCFPPANNECTSESPDFVGYYNEKIPFCNGRARCPDGTQLGGVGAGDNLEFVCLPKPNQEDPNCPGGQSGAVDGKQVCIPKPGADPSCPSGQSGVANGQKVCIPKPGDEGGCKAGETPGFAGTGSEMNATCVPSNYKPETCPAGSYSVNQTTGGFACVTISDGSKPGDDGEESGQGKGGSSDGTAKGSIISKDAAGNVTGKSDIELKLPDGLLQDQPKNTYYKESVDFGDAELEKLDSAAAEVLADFNDPNGMFTERSKLDDASDYMLGLFGYSTGCSGDVVFWNKNGHDVSASCDKLERMKRILGWLIYVTTCMGIFGILTRKNED